MIVHHKESSGMQSLIEFYRPAENTTLYDDLGVHPREDNLEYKCWGQVIPQTGSRNQPIDGYFLERTTHKIIIRYNAKAKLLTADMLMKIRGEEYQILYILNPYGKDEVLEIFAETKLRGSGY